MPSLQIENSLLASKENIEITETECSIGGHIVKIKDR